MRARFFASRYFSAGYFGESAEAAGGSYFGARHFGANYFGAGFYGPVTLTSDITASLDATELADTLESTATAVVEDAGSFSFPQPFRLPRLEPIVANLDVWERGDTCEATAELGFDPVDMDNWLLVAA